MLNRIAARLAIWALTRLFGACPPPHDPDCLMCATARVIAACRLVLEDEI